MNTFFEVILVLFYTILCLWGINKWNYFTTSEIPKKWLNGLFALKISVGFLLYLVYTQFYTVRSEADIFKYFDDSLVVYNGLFQSPIDYLQLVFFRAPDNEYFFDNYYEKMNHWANLHNSLFYGDSVLMIKINAFFRLFSFGSFHVHSIFFNFLSLIGLVGIYRFFKSFVKLNSLWLIGVVFCLPSVLFWSSSVLKESLLILLLGVICYQFYKLNHLRTDRLKPLLYILTSVFFLALLKFYVVIALLIPLTAYLYNNYFKIKFYLVSYLVATLCFLILFFQSSLIDVLVLKQNDFLNLVSNTKAGSYFTIPTLEPTFLSVLYAIPNGIMNCFIQPLPNRELSIMAIPAILENVLILLGVILIIPKLLKKENWGAKHLNGLFFIIFFTVILFAIIGITTPVAGALVRYKVGALPFLGIFIVYFIQSKFKEQ